MLGLASCGLSLLLVPLCRRLALKLDIVDRPSEARKIHQRAIPYLGGLAFYACFLACVLFIWWFYPRYYTWHLAAMLAVGSAVVVLGVYDDVYDPSSRKMLIAELILTSILAFWGLRTHTIVNPFGGWVEVGWLGIVITALWITGVMNAINFSDGLDGLAAGLVFICAAALFAIGYKEGAVTSCLVMACLMGTTLGFLKYNFHPAKIFMGDGGALFLGFLLGATTLIEQQKNVATIALVVPMVVLAVPMLDTFLSFRRRLGRAKEGHFFEADRSHIHHRLLRLGLTQPQVVLALYYLSACMGIFAFILSVLPMGYGFLTLLLAGMLVAFGVMTLRYVERLSKRCPDESDCPRRRELAARVAAQARNGGT